MVHKIKNLSKFVSSYPEAVKVLKKMGLLGKGAWGRLGGKKKNFENIAEHCFVVGLVADIILGKLFERGHLSKELWHQGTLAAILHDATKRFELEVHYGIWKGTGLGHYPGTAMRREISKILFCRTVNPKLRKITSLNEMTGGNAYQLPINKIRPLESKRKTIIWTIFLADHMVALTDIVSPKERMKELRKRYKNPANYKNLAPKFEKVENALKSILKINGRIVDFVKDKAKNL